MRNYIRGTGGLESVEWDPQSPNVSSVPWRNDCFAGFAGFAGKSLSLEFVCVF